MYLQSYVLPVCLYDSSQGDVLVKSLWGTAFFINNQGYFLSARHVFEEAQSVATENKQTVGLVVKGKDGESKENFVAPILNLEFAPEPFDIAIGHCKAVSSTPLRLEDTPIEAWQDVAAYGYPVNAMSGNSQKLNLNIRCHKGYIQRITQPDDIPIGRHPAGYELSFLLSKGLSGAPLFLYRGGYDTVVGVCVGSIRSELIEDSIEEIDDAGKKYREVKVKVDEYGLAHDLRPLLTWKRKFDGRSLHQISSGKA